MLDQPDVVPGLVRGAGGQPFAFVRRGYHPDQVDQVLRGLDARIADLSEALGVAERRAVEAEARAADAAAMLERGRPSNKALGGRLAEMLNLAEAEAAELREGAAAEAAQVRREVQNEAEELRRSCEGEADAVRSAAYQEADQVRSQAASEADQVLKVADRDAEMRLSLAAQQLEALEVRRDDALRSVRVIRDNLNRLVDEPLVHEG